jgi:hypothetical protein
VASPPLDQIPEAGAPAPAPGTLTLVLKTGQRFAVQRLERRGDKVRAQNTKGEVFEVAADQVASPPLSQIPDGTTPAPPAPGTITLVLKNGQRFEVSRLEGRGDKVRAQTAKGDVFEVPVDQIASPSLDKIPGLQSPVPAPTPVPLATPEPLPTPAPPTVQPSPVPVVPDFVPMPDRWQIPYPPYPGRNAPVGRLSDPYNQNVLKGDRPIAGNSVFLVLGAVLDTPTEFRKLPIGSGVSTANPAELEFFGDGQQLFTTPRAAFSRAVQGPGGVPAQDLGAQGQRRLQPQLRALAREQQRRRRRARRLDAPAAGRRSRRSLRRGEARRSLAALRRALAARRHPALRLRLPRVRLQ